MSLLLEALQRASKEKERLASASGAAAKAPPAQKINPASLLSAISAANKPVSPASALATPPPAPAQNTSAPAESGSSLPPLSFDFIPDLPAVDTAHSNDQGNGNTLASTNTPSLETLVFTSSPALDLVISKAEPPTLGPPEPSSAKASYDFSSLSTLPVEDASEKLPEIVEPAPEPLPDEPAPPPAEIAATAQGEEIAPVAVEVAPEPPPPAPEVDNVVAAPPPIQAPYSPPVAAVAEVTKPAHVSPSIDNSKEAASNLVDAAAKPRKPKYKKRDIFLVIVAVIVAGLTASLYLGLWDNYLGIGDSNIAAPAVAVTALPDEPQPVVEAPIEEPAPTKKSEGAMAEIAPGAPKFTLTTPKAAPTAHNAIPKAGQKPLFTARTGAASPLMAGYAALNEGRLDEAADLYNRALKSNSDERDALMGMAYIAQRQGRTDEARAYYQRVLRVEPDNAAAGAGLLALASEGDIPAAASRARDMAERYPESAAAFATLGHILVREGRIADAQQAYFKAVTLEPEEAFHTYNLAVALDRLHKPAQAKTYYERALTLADKSGATTARNFPRDAVVKRLEQLGAPGSPAANPVTPPLVQ